ncbi:MAG: IS1182 family transposase [Candidatus Delongbacteria bacterium]|nr:IS1182 family transposase [Candidatus Delongbacteria bacterium]
MNKEGIKITTIHNDEELFLLTEEMKTTMLEAAARDKKKEKELTGNIEAEQSDNFRDYNQDQTFFITVSKEGFIEENHPAVIINTIIERLNLENLYATYSKEGNKAYHPKMMLKILFYAYYCRIMTSRTIWKNVINRCDFIYLAAGQVPNFRTINAFRLRHFSVLPGIFSQIVMLCRELDMIGMDHLAIDGEKIQANANFKKSKNLSQVKAELEKLEKGIKNLLEQEVNEVTTEEKVNKRINKLSKKISKLQSLEKQLEEIGDEKKRINLTDPDAPVMKHKDSRSRPSYNHQTARDEKCGVVTAVETTLSGDVPDDLLPLVNKSIENTGARHKHITADSGFQSYANLEKMETRPEDFFVPDRRYKSTDENNDKKKFTQEKFTKNEDGTYNCPGGKVMKKIRTITTKDGEEAIIYETETCWNCMIKGMCTSGQKRQIVVDVREPLREKMRDKLKTDFGREMYMKRQGLIEPIHGDDQKNSGWIQHLLRGYWKAKGEFMLIRLVNNLRSIIKHRGAEIMAFA